MVYTPGADKLRFTIGGTTPRGWAVADFRSGFDDLERVQQQCANETEKKTAVGPFGLALRKIQNTRP